MKNRHELLSELSFSASPDLLARGKNLQARASALPSGQASPIDLIRAIVEAEPLELTAAIVERVLTLLVEVVAEEGRNGATVDVPELGIFDAVNIDGQLGFRFYEAG